MGRLIIWPTGTVDNNPDDDDIDYIALMMTTLSRSIPKSGTNHSLLAERGGVKTLLFYILKNPTLVALDLWEAFKGRPWHADNLSLHW